MRQFAWLVLMGVLLCGVAGAAPIVGVTCTGSWSNDASGGGTYGCGGAIDGITNDVVSGPGGRASYWLGRDLTSGNSANETLTFDLGALFLIDSFDIFNTHNGLCAGCNDRGTVNFQIWISQNPVIPDTLPGASFGDLVLTDALAYYTVNPNPLQHFDITPELGRYVTFRATSFVRLGAGLSELSVNTEVPEPAAGLLCAAALAVAFAIRRRRAHA